MKSDPILLPRLLNDKDALLVYVYCFKNSCFRFISIGKDFCRFEGNDSAETIKIADTLNEPLRKQTLAYFRKHHAGRMEELSTFLEVEAWQPCPVRSTFTVLDMQVVANSILHQLQQQISSVSRFPPAFVEISV